MVIFDNASILNPCCSIRQTPHSGRGVFAADRIASGTVLLSTAPPAVSVIHRPYRKEVCAYCFEYNRGRAWSIRDNAVGFVFCSEICQREWRLSCDSRTLESYKCVEDAIKRKRKLSKGEDADEPMLDVDTESPSEDDIVRAWADAAASGREIIAARKQPQPSKSQRRALQAVNSRPLDPSSIAYLHSGLICYLNAPEQWGSLIQLHETRTPYLARALLSQDIDAYLHLLSVLPLHFLCSMTTDLCKTLASRDAHNAFGIRSLEDDGDEFFGHGVWPEASYWNHSCEPNVMKKRQGGSWTFLAGRDIEAEEELCITYLGGDERRLAAHDRKERLRKEWGFLCTCRRCQQES